MAETPAFHYVASTLESLTEMNEVQARGTLRLSVKEAGLNPRKVTAAEMSVVVEKLLPKELQLRSVENAEDVLQKIGEGLLEISDDQTIESTDTVMERMGTSISRLKAIKDAKDR